jgi:hypothetical protein
MADPLLHDAVTLRHFASCQLLSLCASLHSTLPVPRWTEAVHDEVQRAAAIGRQDCAAILSEVWLDTPITPSIKDQRGIYRIRIALNRSPHPPNQDAGEAESIYFAEQLGGLFATDDNAAYAFAERRLGAGRVCDTVDILRAGVRGGYATPADAALAAATIRRAGRHLRRVHPANLTDSYFR